MWWVRRRDSVVRSVYMAEGRVGWSRVGACFELGGMDLG